MSHDTHNHHDNHNDKPEVQFKTGIIFPIMLIALFLASIAFVQSMSHNDSGHGDGHGTPHKEATHEGAPKATSDHGDHKADGHDHDAEH